MDTRKIKISSNITIWHKRIFPILSFIGLIVICILMILFFQRDAISGLFFFSLLGIPIFISLFFVLLKQCFFNLKLLDEVYYDERALYIKNRNVEQIISFSEVSKLKYIWWGTQRIKVTLFENNKKLYFAVLGPISFFKGKHPSVIKFLKSFEDYKSSQS